MYYCSKCGGNHPEEAVFCPHCGHKFESLGNRAAPENGIESGPPPEAFSPNLQAPHVYAGFWKRVVACVLDSIVQIGLMFLALMICFMLGMEEMASETQDQILTVISLLIIWLYNALMESSGKQATIGKMILGIKVTDLDGNRIGFGRATGRFAGKFVSQSIACIGYLMVAFTQKKQGLHDMLASCLVVNKHAFQNRQAGDDFQFSGTGTQSAQGLIQKGNPARKRGRDHDMYNVYNTGSTGVNEYAKPSESAESVERVDSASDFGSWGGGDSGGGDD